MRAGSYNIDKGFQGINQISSQPPQQYIQQISHQTSDTEKKRSSKASSLT